MKTTAVAKHIDFLHNRDLHWDKCY